MEEDGCRNVDGLFYSTVVEAEAEGVSMWGQSGQVLVMDLLQ